MSRGGRASAEWQCGSQRASVGRTGREGKGGKQQQQQEIEVGFRSGTHGRGTGTQISSGPPMGYLFFRILPRRCPPSATSDVCVLACELTRTARPGNVIGIPITSSPYSFTCIYDAHH